MKEAEKRYRPRYAESLTLSRRNLVRAMVVYEYGVLHHRGIVSAIVEIVGYRYRRLENFLRECDLWRAGIGWLLPIGVKKIFCGYEERKKKRMVGLEIYIHQATPEVFVGEVDRTRLREFFFEFCEFVKPWDEWGWLADIDWRVMDVGEACHFERWRHHFCSVQDFYFVVHFLRHGRLIYALEGEGEEACWYFHRYVLDPAIRPPFRIIRMREAM